MDRCFAYGTAPGRLLRPARTLLAAVVAAGALFSAHVADAQPTEIVSLTATNGPTNNASDSPSISAGRRYVAFVSKANNIVAGDTNGRADIFVRDRTLGTTVRVSVSSNGGESDKDSAHPSISSDGRFVAFDSVSATLVANDGNGQKDVFLHDRDADGDGIFDEPGAISTVRVSVDENGGERTRAATSPAVSGDGRWVAFEAAEGSGKTDIRIYDREAGRSRVASTNDEGSVGNGKSEHPQLSGSGRYLVFESNANNLVADDDNGAIDIFWIDRDADEDGVFDQASGTLVLRASLNTDGREGDGASTYPDVSDDGMHVTFASMAKNLDAGITNNKRDVFVRDMGLGFTFRISLGPDGVQGSAESTLPWISGDGRCIAFQSAAPELVSNDTNGRRDVFLYDRDVDQNGDFDDLGGVTLSRVSLGAMGVEANNHSGDIVRPALSADGLGVVFNSPSTNLVGGDENGKRDVFLRTTRCSSSGFGFVPITPCRLVDTRDENGPVGGPSISGNQERAFSAADVCGIPSRAKALAAIITVVAPGAAGFFTLYPPGTSRPLASSVNFTAGQTRTNNQFISLSTDGLASFGAYNGAAESADLLIDVTGYFN